MDCFAVSCPDSDIVIYRPHHPCHAAASQPVALPPYRTYIEQKDNIKSSSDDCLQLNKEEIIRFKKKKKKEKKKKHKKFRPGQGFNPGPGPMKTERIGFADQVVEW